MKIIRSMLLICLTISILWLGGLLTFIHYVKSISREVYQAGAIVVLTGGSERVEEAINLLKKGKAPYLFVSGADRGVKAGDLLREAGISSNNTLKNSIIVGTSAVDTFGNAEEVSTWLSTQNIDNLILVTSNYHMPRALIEFYFIGEKIKIQPYPVISPNVEIDNWWKTEGSRNFLINEYNKTIGATLRASLIPILGGRG